MRWSTTLAAWTRREAALVTVLAAAAAAAALAKPLHAPWLAVTGAATAAAGAGTRAVIAARRAHLENLQEQAERTRRLLVPAGPAAQIDPTRVGVDPAAQAILPGGPVPAYVRREIDPVLEEALAAALAGTGHWLVVVAGTSKTGKSRTLFEALRRCAPHGSLPLIAPDGGEALRELLVPGQDLRLGNTPAVLWLDDLEPFLNEGITFRTLCEWHETGPGRIVAATYGGKGSERVSDAPAPGLATITGSVLAHAHQVMLEITSAAELGELASHLDGAQRQAIARHGLAAFLVAGPKLENKLATGLHAAGERPCPEGPPLVYAAADWARCGRTDPISEETLRQLWPAYLPPGTPATDEAFTTALTWALKPVAGTISLLQTAGSYTAYDYAVHLADTKPGPPPPRTWDTATHTATHAQAFAVAVAAYQFGLPSKAATAFDRARNSSDSQTAATAGYNLGVTLGELGRSQEAVTAYDQVVERYGGDPAPALRELTARALFNKGVALGVLGRSQDEVTACGQVVERYGGDPAPALRELTARALVNKGARLGVLGRSQDEVTACGQVVERYGGDPAPVLRELTARALVNKGARLGVLGRSQDEVTACGQVVERYGGDPAPVLRELTARALVNKGARLGVLGRSQDEVTACGQVVERYGGDPAPVLRELTARALVNKGVALGELGRSQEAVTTYGQVVERYGGDPAPVLRELTARALVNKGVALGELGRSQEAVTTYGQVLERYGGDPAPALREVTGRVREALAEMSDEAD